MILCLKFLPEQITVIHAVTWKRSGRAEGQIIPEIPPNGLCIGHSLFLVVALSTIQEGQRRINSPSPLLSSCKPQANLLSQEAEAKKVNLSAQVRLSFLL